MSNSTRDSSVYLRHIRDCCREIAECYQARQNAGVSEAIILSAVCRNIEIIGEAANKLSPDFRAMHPDIPWRRMISARNILIHNYDGVEPEIVWGIVVSDIPALLVAVEELLT